MAVLIKCIINLHIRDPTPWPDKKTVMLSFFVTPLPNGSINVIINCHIRGYVIHVSVLSFVLPNGGVCQ